MVWELQILEQRGEYFVQRAAVVVLVAGWDSNCQSLLEAWVWSWSWKTSRDRLDRPFLEAMKSDICAWIDR